MLNRKGQNSFEILLITVIVFVIVIDVSTAYFSIHASNTALELFKLDAIDKLNALDKEYFINRIEFKEFPEEKEIVMCLYTTPFANNLFSNQEITEWQNKIKEKTGYETLKIEINPIQCAR